MKYKGETIEQLISEKDIANRIVTLAKEITTAYAGKSITLIGTLKGALHFMSDLARKIDLDVEIEFIKPSSYGDKTETSGNVVLEYSPATDLTGRNVIVVEDIIDTGHTAHFVLNHIAKKRPASLAICALLDKPARRETPVSIDYIGFSIPDAFVVGYGLDYAQRYRNLSYIGVLKFEEVLRGPRTS